MTVQFKVKTGGRGIEWCDHTINVTGGCLHGCRWTMPDGTVAICYAETVAENLAREAYKEGFAHHYYRPGQLKAFGRLPHPALVFIDSMSDLFGMWTPDEHVLAVLRMVAESPQHTAQVLTKNPGRILKYLDHLPPNLWVGVSSPPDFMNGKQLNGRQQAAMLKRSMDVLAQVNEVVPVVWMSMEPVSWDMAPLLTESHPLKWVVIGAATNGPKKYQPDPGHIAGLLELFDKTDTPVFFKGNLDWSPRRENFPVVPGYDHAVRRRQEMAQLHGWPLNDRLPAVATQAALF